MIKYFKAFRVKLFADITAVPIMLREGYYPSLDGLRAIAILQVIFAHFSVNGILSRFNIRIVSTIGVHIFFVLSGFLITTVLVKKKILDGRISPASFYARRSLRIIPLAYLFLVVLLVISVAYKPMSSKADFLYSFFFLKNLPVQHHPFTAHLWTLSLEAQFYIVMPLLLLFRINRFFIWAVFVVTVFPLLSIFSYYSPAGLHGFTQEVFFKIVNYAFWKGPIILLIGAVAALLVFKGFIKLGWASNYYFLSFFLLIAAVIISTPTCLLYHKYISEYLSAMLFAFVILLNIQSANFLSKILSSPVLVNIGRWSYSLYIWQQLFIGKFFWIPCLRWLNPLPVSMILLLKLIILFPLAYASYRLVEMPFLKRKAKFN
jgi:peptidoglycan/LPS O-acetylase OafA/YrhL